MPFTLPPLPYSYDALEPFIDAKTMQLHHDKHHQTYVTNLNKALERHPEFQAMSIEELLRGISRVPDDSRAAVRNHGGGHANHTMLWEIMGPKTGGEPSGAVADAIKSSFGGFDKFKEQFASAAADLFGSGWVWLVEGGGQLTIETTSNQDSLLMLGKHPIVGLDVWQHAYYLTYQNRRADYVKAWWNVVNWSAVGERFNRQPVGTSAGANRAERGRADDRSQR